MAARFDTARFGTDLRWEPARGGALFPHLYRPLRLAEVVEVVPLQLPAPSASLKS
jgi:uncharacterized protein (DUF952 family)